jgi:hypothetical protein
MKSKLLLKNITRKTKSSKTKSRKTKSKKIENKYVKNKPKKASMRFFKNILQKFFPKKKEKEKTIQPRIILPNNKTITKLEEYETHEQIIRPYKVKVYPSHIVVFNNDNNRKVYESKYEKIFIGDNDLDITENNYSPKGEFLGNTILIKTRPGEYFPKENRFCGAKYIYIGEIIESFKTLDNEEIINYNSIMKLSGYYTYKYGIGGPIAFAIGENNTYLISSNKIIPNKVFYLNIDIYNLPKNLELQEYQPNIIHNLETETYYTHENGGRPYIVRVYPKTITVYFTNIGKGKSKKVFESKYDKIFIGHGDAYTKDIALYDYNKWSLGNSILIKIDNGKYIFIGSMITTLDTVDNEEIKEYYSAVGNNDVPYPYAVGENYTYFILYDKYVPNKELDLKSDGYIQFYDNRKLTKIDYKSRVIDQSLYDK